jgi:hypothetical protein
MIAPRFGGVFVLGRVAESTMDDEKKNEQDWKTQNMLAELELARTPIDPKIVDKWWLDVVVVRPEYSEIHREAVEYMSLLKDADADEKELERSKQKLRERHEWITGIVKRKHAIP